MMEMISQVHERNLVKWAKDKPEVVIFSGDLTGSTEIREFRDTYPDRFFQMGMAEQNMLSWAGGMAREGYTPFLHTFAVFLYRRPYDQLAMSVAYPNLRVRLFGFLPGITTPGGVTHQAIEDIALLRAVPNMTIFEVADATEVESVLDVAQAVNGPVYVRMIRGLIPRLFDQSKPLEFNKARVLSEGDDLTIFSSGICTEEAMIAVKALKEKGLSIQHMHISTLKPFTDPAVVKAASKPRYGVITLENHTIIGGLGSAVAEVMAEAGIGKKLKRIGIYDTFAHGASREYLMHKMGIDSIALVKGVEEMVGQSFDIDTEQLAQIKIDTKYKVQMTQLEGM